MANGATLELKLRISSGEKGAKQHGSFANTNYYQNLSVGYICGRREMSALHRNLILKHFKQI